MIGVCKFYDTRKTGLLGIDAKPDLIMLLHSGKESETSGYISYYPQISAATTFYNVMSTNGYSGISGSGDSYAFCASAEALQDNYSGFVSVNDALTKIKGKNKLTIAFWYYYAEYVTKDIATQPFAISAGEKSDSNKRPFFDAYTQKARFILTNNIFVFETDHYYTGSFVTNFLRDMKWNHIMLQIDARDSNEDSQMNLYVNGFKVSTLSAKPDTDIESDRFVKDIIGLADCNRMVWNVPNLDQSKNGGSFTDFAIYNNIELDLKATEYEIPAISAKEAMGINFITKTVFNFTTINADGPNQMGGSNHGTNDGNVAHNQFVNPNADAGSTKDNQVKGCEYRFLSKMVVPQKRLNTYVLDCYMEVSTEKVMVTVDIPFPYKQFIDADFFVVKSDGSFVPEHYYERINDKQIRFRNGNPLGIGNTDLKFIFCHKQEFNHVHKYEQTETLDNKNMAYFNSPFTDIVNLQERVRVFYNRQFVEPDTSNYEFDNYTGYVTFTNDFIKSMQRPGVEDSKEVSFLCFYTGYKENGKAIARLPMSGYIEFMKDNVDRIYDKDLYATFINGELVDNKDIMDMTSRIHKISRDIQTRWDLNVLGMSPRIPYITPYLNRRFYKKKIKKVPYFYEFPCTMRVYYPDKPFGRFYVLSENTTIFNPIECKPIVPDNLNYYITLIHHGLDEYKPNGPTVQYTLQFFRDDVWPNAEPVKVIAMVRPRATNEEEYYPTSPNAVLLGSLPSSISGVAHDTPIFTIKASDVYASDTDLDRLKPDAVDGIMCRFEFYPTKKDKYKRLYYTLTTNHPEIRMEVNVFEWVISTEPNGQGTVYYRKSIGFRPTTVTDQKSLGITNTTTFNRYDWIYDGGFGDSGFFEDTDVSYTDPKVLETGIRSSTTLDFKKIKDVDMEKGRFTNEINTIRKTSSYKGDNGEYPPKNKG